MIRNFLRILVLASLLCMSMMAFAQQRISGKVKDSGGEPLIGVNIVEIGTTNGTVTDIDGNYTISIGKKECQTTILFYRLCHARTEGKTQYAGHS